MTTHRAVPGAWHRRRRTWWTTSLRTCRCASGCFLCRSRLRQTQSVHWTDCVRAQLLLAAQPKLMTPVLQVVHRVITRHLLGQAGLKPDEADSGAVTLIRRFGSAANLNIHRRGAGIAVGTPITERPPAQIRACAIHALGSHLGCLTENLVLGQG